MEQLLRRITAVAHDAAAHGHHGRDLANSLFALVDEFDERPDAAIDAPDAAEAVAAPAEVGAVRGLFVRLVSRHGMNDNAVRRTLRRAGVADALAVEPALTIADDGLSATAIYQLDDASQAAADRLLGRRDRLTGEFSGIQYAVELAPVGPVAAAVPAPPAAHTDVIAPAAAGGGGMTLECVFRRADGEAFDREDMFTVIGAAEDHLGEHLPDLTLRRYEQVDDELHVRLWTSADDDRSRQIAAMWGPADTDIDDVGTVNGNCVQVI